MAKQSSENPQYQWRILHVEDDEGFRLITQRRIEQHLDTEVHYSSCQNLKEAQNILKTDYIDLILLDKMLKNKNSIPYIKKLQSLSPHSHIVMLTASDDTRDIAIALAEGASNYLQKDADEKLFIEVIKHSLYNIAKIKKIAFFEKKTDQRPISLAGSSAIISSARNKLIQISKTNLPVLITGESGTGKSYAARYIHQNRLLFENKHTPFLVVNLSALPESLIESELFGHVKGSFSGATADKKGILEVVNGGTLFLDEIGEIPLNVQKKLLLVLEEGNFYRVGDPKRKLHSAFKLISATNQDLEEQVREGTFREDLYMRLSTFPIHMPNLSERREDMAEIIESILPEACAKNSVQIPFAKIPQELISFLKQKNIRGNLRGLFHVISRLLVLSDKDANGQPLFDNWRSLLAHDNFIKNPAQKNINVAISSDESLQDAVQGFEKQIIIRALKQSTRQTEAAQKLKVPVQTLHTKITRYRIDPRLYLLNKRRNKNHGYRNT